MNHRVSSEEAFSAADPAFVTIDAAIHDAVTKSKKGSPHYVSTFDKLRRPTTFIIGRAVKGVWQWACEKCSGARCAACVNEGYR